MSSALSLTLYEVPDTEEGVIRLDPSDMHMLGVMPGDVIAVEGARKCFVRVKSAFMEDRNQRLARVGPLTATNLGYRSGQVVRLLPDRIRPPFAELMTLQADDDLDRLHLLAREKQLSSFWRERTVLPEDLLNLPTLEGQPITVKVAGVQPAGPVQIGPLTTFSIGALKSGSDLPRLGGLRDIYRETQNLIEGHFKRRNPQAARSVLLYGPGGCGKATLVARLAKESGLALRVFDCYQLMDQWLAHRSTELNVSLTEIARRGQTLILVDHLEALCGKKDETAAIAIAARSVTSQICALLEEVRTQPNLIAFATSSKTLDERFDNNRLFDLRIPVDAPNRWGRTEILMLAAQSVPLAADVDLPIIATMTPGATGRDLCGLLSSAGLMAMGAKVTQRDMLGALRSLVPSAAHDVRCDIPTTLWDDVAGLDDVKQTLREALSWSLRQYDQFVDMGVHPPRSILLSGGQGTGKTSLVRSLAGILPVHFIEVNCSALVTQTTKDSVAYLREAFVLARRKAPCLVFFDDIDVLFEIEGDDADIAPYRHSLVAQLIVDLDSLMAQNGIVVIAATNRPDRLTTEIMRPGRLDFVLTLPMPDAPARKKIFQIHARKMPLAADIDFDRLANATQGLSAAEIADLCNRVGMIALRNSLSGPEGGVIPPTVNADLFEQALRGRKN